MATIGQPLTAPETGWKRYDDTHPAIKYVGTWTKGTYSGSYGTTMTYANGEATVNFKFIGTKFRLIGRITSGYATNIEVIIDGISYGVFSQDGATAVHQSLNFEVLGLENTHHDVILFKNNGIDAGKNILIDAIDIDSTGRLLHPYEVTDPKDLVVGKRIRCHYTAPTSGQVGIFSNLGQETYKDGSNDFIPPASSAISNGDFYFIMVEDWNGKKRLIADRNIQHSISWDTLNSEGIASGSGYLHEHDLQSSLVAWYTMQDGGTTLIDHAGNQNGTISGATFVDNGSGGKALSFDGINDYVSFSQKVTPIGNKTIRFKIKTTSTLASALLSQVYDSTTHYGTQVHLLDTGVIYWRRFANNSTPKISLQSAKKINDGLWHDILLIEDGSDCKMYIDNTLEISGTTTAIESVAPTLNLTIGARYRNISSDYDSFFSGQLSNLEIYNDVIDPSTTIPTNDNFAFTTRLLTGGISSTDKDNEWDQYIVNSTLGGTITAGDNNIWNWKSDTRTWTSTSTSSASYRVLRGAVNSQPAEIVSNWSSAVSSESISGRGFRPVVEIEPLFVEVLKYLFSDGEGIKSYDAEASQWTVVGAAPVTSEMFTQYGMLTISGLTPSDYQLLMDNFDIYVESNNLPKTYTSSMTAIPKPQLILANGDIDLSQIANIDSFTLQGAESLGGVVRAIVSFDAGVSWKTFKNGAWAVVDTNNLPQVKADGLTMAGLSAITSTDWAACRGQSNTIRLGYYLEMTDGTSIAETDALISQLDLHGFWEKALESEARYAYTSNTNLRIRFFANGNYKVNYQ